VSCYAAAKVAETSGINNFTLIAFPNEAGLLFTHAELAFANEDFIALKIMSFKSKANSPTSFQPHVNCRLLLRFGNISISK